MSSYPHYLPLRSAACDRANKLLVPHLCGQDMGFSVGVDRDTTEGIPKTWCGRDRLLIQAILATAGYQPSHEAMADKKHPPSHKAMADN